MGVPTKPEEYSLDRAQLPAGMAYDDGFEKWFRQTAHTAHLSADQAKEIFGAYTAQRVAAFNAEAEAQKQVQQKTIGELRKEWGDQYDARMERTVKLINSTGGEEVQAFLQKATVDGVKAGDHPAIIKYFAKLSDLIGEDNLVRGSSRDSGGDSTGGWKFPNTPSMKGTR